MRGLFWGIGTGRYSMSFHVLTPVSVRDLKTFPCRPVYMRSMVNSASSINQGIANLRLHFCRHGHQCHLTPLQLGSCPPKSLVRYIAAHDSSCHCRCYCLAQTVEHCTIRGRNTYGLTFFSHTMSGAGKSRSGRRYECSTSKPHSALQTWCKANCNCIQAELFCSLIACMND